MHGEHNVKFLLQQWTENTSDIFLCSVNRLTVLKCWPVRREPKMGLLSPMTVLCIWGFVRIIELNNPCHTLKSRNTLCWPRNSQLLRNSDVHFYLHKSHLFSPIIRQFNLLHIFTLLIETWLTPLLHLTLLLPCDFLTSFYGHIFYCLLNVLLISSQQY